MGLFDMFGGGDSSSIMKRILQMAFNSIVGKVQEYKLDDELQVQLKIDFVDVQQTEAGVYETYRIEGYLVKKR